MTWKLLVIWSVHLENPHCQKTWTNFLKRGLWPGLLFQIILWAFFKKYFCAVCQLLASLCRGFVATALERQPSALSNGTRPVLTFWLDALFQSWLAQGVTALLIGRVQVWLVKVKVVILLICLISELLQWLKPLNCAYYPCCWALQIGSIKRMIR